MGKKRTFTVSWGANLTSRDRRANVLIFNAPGTAEPVVTPPRHPAQEPLTRFTLPVNCRAIKATLTANNLVGIRAVHLRQDRGDIAFSAEQIFNSSSDPITVMSRGGETSLVHLRHGLTFEKGDVATINWQSLGDGSQLVPRRLTVQITFKLL